MFGLGGSSLRGMGGGMGGSYLGGGQGPQSFYKMGAGGGMDVMGTIDQNNQNMQNMWSHPYAATGWGGGSNPYGD